MVVVVVVGVDERESGGGRGQHGRVGGGSHHHVWQLRLLVRFPRIHGGCTESERRKQNADRRAVVGSECVRRERVLDLIEEERSD